MREEPFSFSAAGMFAIALLAVFAPPRPALSQDAAASGVSYVRLWNADIKPLVGVTARLRSADGGATGEIEGPAELGAVLRRAARAVFRTEMFPEPTTTFPVVEIDLAHPPALDAEPSPCGGAIAFASLSAATGELPDAGVVILGDIAESGAFLPSHFFERRLRDGVRAERFLILPASAESEVADRLLREGPSGILGPQIYLAENLAQIAEIAGSVRTEALSLAIGEMDQVIAVLHRSVAPFEAQWQKRNRTTLPALRQKRNAALTAILKNGHVMAKLEKVSAASPGNLTARLFLAYARDEHPRKVSLPASIRILREISGDAAFPFLSGREKFDQRTDAFAEAVTEFRKVAPLLPDEAKPAFLTLFQFLQDLNASRGVLAQKGTLIPNSLKGQAKKLDQDFAELLQMSREKNGMPFADEELALGAAIELGVGIGSLRMMLKNTALHAVLGRDRQGQSIILVKSFEALLESFEKG